MKKAYWQNWMNIFLGVALFIMPWTLDYKLTEKNVELINFNFWIVGLVVVIIAASALRNLKPFYEWVNVILGTWMFLSPLVLGFPKESSHMLNSMLLGLTIAIVSGISLPKAWKLQHHGHNQ